MLWGCSQDWVLLGSAWPLHLDLHECGSGHLSDTAQSLWGLILALPVPLLMHFMACFVLLAECTWLFIRKLDCLIQCFIVLSLFTRAFGALQNTSSCFCGMGKWEQNLDFRGKMSGQAEGRRLWDPLCFRETWGLGEVWPPPPSHCSASIS